jgi:ribosome-dependent ATPase
VRQRLSLAVAVIHEPELLILDEPTSGVDPVARDGFWELLLELSRERGVTIFISTHFMNEAERCDRISLMHAGRVLAQGTPAALKSELGAETLEDAFISHMEAAAAEVEGDQPILEGSEQVPVALPKPLVRRRPRRFSLRRLWAYARREGIELRRDPIRLAFALLGPVLLMIAMGYGISFDVDDIDYAVLDRDRTPASRAYLEQFSGSPWFSEQNPLADGADRERRLISGRLALAIEIPPGFGRDLKRGARPEVGFLIDGAIPFRGDTIRGYAQGVHQHYLEDLRIAQGQPLAEPPVEVVTRFRYNQAFKSVYAMVPGILMLLLIMIPATMTAVGVVREKELGSITNLYATPTTGGEFLLGKQLPYMGLALLSYLILLLMALFLFRVPLTGGLGALTLGAVLFVFASTGVGLLMSTFMRSQIAAVFGTAIASVIPTILFSGMLVPVSSLTGPARIMGYGFPSAWFNHVSVGSFTKGLTFRDLWLDFPVLGAFGLGFFLLGLALLRTQER